MVGPRKPNRKRSGKTCFPFPLAAALTVAATMALGYLWLCSRSEALANQLKQLEVKDEAVRRRLVNEEYRWSHLSSPRSIEAALARFDLPLRWPAERQVVHLSRPLRLHDLRPGSLEVPQLARHSAYRDGEVHD